MADIKCRVCERAVPEEGAYNGICEECMSFISKYGRVMPDLPIEEIHAIGS